VECCETLLSYLGIVRPADFVKFGDIFEMIALHDLCPPYPLWMVQKQLGGNNTTGKLIMMLVFSP
jgi:hypothetical protein